MYFCTLFQGCFTPKLRSLAVTALMDVAVQTGIFFLFHRKQLCIFIVLTRQSKSNKTAHIKIRSQEIRYEESNNSIKTGIDVL